MAIIKGPFAPLFWVYNTALAHSLEGPVKTGLPRVAVSLRPSTPLSPTPTAASIGFGGDCHFLCAFLKPDQESGELTRQGPQLPLLAETDCPVDSGLSHQPSPPGWLVSA